MSFERQPDPNGHEWPLFVEPEMRNPDGSVTAACRRCEATVTLSAPYFDTDSYMKTKLIAGPKPGRCAGAPVAAS